MNKKKFKLDSDQEAARVAYEWFRAVKRDFIYDLTLHKALYDEIDITELIKGIEVNLMKDPGTGGAPSYKDPGTGS